MQDLQTEIRRLVKAIYELRRSSGRWVTWKAVARHQTGSREAAALLHSLAELPEWRHLFAITQNAVKLTDEGMQLAATLDTEDTPTTSMIADAVIAYARGLRPIALDIQSMSVVAQAGSKTVHAVFVELSDEVLPTETPVMVTCQTGRPVYGKLVGQEVDGDVLYVACDTDILPSQVPTTLIIDRAYLLTQLAEQLRSLHAIPDRLLAVLTSQRQPVIEGANSRDVAERLAQLPSPWTRFLWGPPGAGKTYGLGHLVSRLITLHPHETVLIVAPSNRAVDVAVSQLRTHLALNSVERLIHDRRVLRFGYTRSTELLGIKELLGPANLDALSKRVHQISQKIKHAEHEHGTLSDLAVVRAELLAAQEAVKEAVREHVSQCCVVGTTTTLAYMANSPVASQFWDSVIVDEVTMVPPAVCAFLASRAKRRLLLAGDPCQLGPVYEERNVVDGDSRLWLKNDVFTIGGVSSGQLSADAIKTSDSRLVRISAQRRCATDIWDHISHLYPEVDNASNRGRTRDIAAMSPSPGEQLVLVDTSGGGAKCEKMKKSWCNPDSARIAINVAWIIASEAPSDFRIAIICPYRAQAKLLRQLIRDEGKEDTPPDRRVIIEAGTVHQFQGSEADAVIFDLVDGPSRKNLGLLLRGDSGIRLVNVAISRARGKLIVIANRDWCRNVDVAAHNYLLSQLISRQAPSSVAGAAPRSRGFQVDPSRWSGGRFDSVTRRSATHATCNKCRTFIPNNPHIAGKTLICPSCGDAMKMPTL